MPYAIPYNVRKTSVYLSPAEVARLSTLAEQEGTSQAELIRRAIRLYEPERRGDRNFSLLASGEGSGSSVADVDEDELLEGFGS